jgi:hypothetical protein
VARFGIESTLKRLTAFWSGILKDGMCRCRRMADDHLNLNEVGSIAVSRSRDDHWREASGVFVVQ